MSDFVLRPLCSGYLNTDVGDSLDDYPPPWGTLDDDGNVESQGPTGFNRVGLAKTAYDPRLALTPSPQESFADDPNGIHEGSEVEDAL